LSDVLRYAARRKQGGAQSANDAGKGKAKSAGAMIRRHNEAALTDVRCAVLSSALLGRRSLHALDLDSAGR